MDLKIWANLCKGTINLSHAQWVHVSNSKFILSEQWFSLLNYLEKEIWLHLPQFTKAQDTQTWRIAFAGGNKSTYYPGNKYGTHTVLNSAAEIQWRLREKCSSSSCSEGPGLHHLPQGCCLFLWTSTVQFTGKIFWKTPNTHIMEK